MENKRKSKEKINNFTEGKGFYITLAVCLCVIGASGYVLFFAPAAAPVYEVEAPPMTTAAYSDVGAVIPDVKIELEKEPTTEKVREKPVDKPVTVIVPEATTAAEQAEKLYVPPVIGKISKSFSKGELVYDKTMGDYRTHNGVDIECELGAQVACFADGTVARVYNDELYGNSVVISHEGGIKSIYRGLSNGVELTEGAAVSAGDIIGAAGGTNITESEEAPHVHFEVMCDGEYIDPFELIE